MVSNLVECAIDNIEVDMLMTAVFDDVTPEVILASSDWRIRTAQFRKPIGG